jgi:DNA-binding transcriptional MocR family regulator
MPEGISVRALFDRAMQAGVSFAPGEAFYAVPNDQPYIRLNFAALEPARIETGIERLGALVRTAVQKEIDT